jgi:hypothetical protein
MTHKERTIELLNKLTLPGGQFKDTAPGKGDIKQMFDLYNEVHKQKERASNCGGCRKRVLIKLLAYAVNHYNYVV